MTAAVPGTHESRVGRYLVHAEIASGGMATVHLGRLIGSAGFMRTVAIKRLRPHLANDPEFVSSFVDEARLAACIRHANVVATLDVVEDADEILVVMDYVHGESLGRLVRAPNAPVPVVLTVVSQVLHGLHAAHEATSPRGEPLQLVHRDVSPQNVVVGVDGVARVVDFGIAKATWRLQETRDGALKGKIAYMAPEQLNWRPLDRRADIFAASIVLWEALTGERLFASDDADETVRRILGAKVPPPSSRRRGLPSGLDAIVLRGLAAAPENRFATAIEMAVALEEVGGAPASEIGAWVAETARDALATRAQMVRELEQSAQEPIVPSGTRAIARGVERAAARQAPTVVEQPLTLARPASAMPPAEPRKRVRPRARLLTAAAVLVASIAAVSLVVRHGVTRRAAAEPAASSAGPLPEASVEAPAPVPVPAREPRPPLVAPSASAVSTPRARPRLAPPPAGHTPRTDKCNPPYMVGPDGVRRFRPECV